MTMEKKVEGIEDEIKVLKGQIKETLTDIREHLLTYIENPFAASREAPIIEVTAMHHKIVVQAPDEPHVQTALAAPAPAPGPQAAQPEAPAAPVAAPVGVSPPVEAVQPSPQSAPAPAQQLGPAPQPAPQAAPMPSPFSMLGIPGLEPLPPLIGNGDIPDFPELGSNDHPGQESQSAPDESTDNGSERVGGRPRTAGGGGGPGPKPSAKGDGSKADGMKRTGKDLEDTNALLTMFTLVPWLDGGIKRIGRKRMKTIVEVYASTGKLDDQMKESIMQIIGMDNSPDGARSKATIKECLSVLGELDNLLWRNKLDPAGAALMAMILDEKQSV